MHNSRVIETNEARDALQNSFRKTTLACRAEFTEKPQEPVRQTKNRAVKKSTRAVKISPVSV
jgi:hypothetical protein